MLWLTGATGQVVRTSGGFLVGRVADLTVRLSSGRPTPQVGRVLVRLVDDREALVDWSEILGFEHELVELTDGAVVQAFDPRRVGSHLADDELLLGRDVLDTQIVDVVGHRLARVADVAMGRNLSGELEVLAVEIGFGRVLERLGLRWLPVARSGESIAWTDLHLTSDRGHLVQLASPASAVHRLSDGDLAALVARLDLDSAAEVLSAAGAVRTAGAIVSADPPVGERLLRALPESTRAAVLENMPAEHAHRWRHRMSHERPLRGRRFFRGSGWRRRRSSAHHASDRRRR